MTMGCPRAKYFFSGLPNLLPQKIRLPLISFFSGISYIWGSYIWGSALKNQTAPDFFFLWSQLHLGRLHRERAVSGRIFQALPTQTDRQTPLLL